ncbi:hypothetical protein ACJX0J_032161, partial [Zea mays]
VDPLSHQVKVCEFGSARILIFHKRMSPEAMDRLLEKDKITIAVNVQFWHFCLSVTEMDKYSCNGYCHSGEVGVAEEIVLREEMKREEFSENYEMVEKGDGRFGWYWRATGCSIGSDIWLGYCTVCKACLLQTDGNNWYGNIIHIHLNVSLKDNSQYHIRSLLCLVYKVQPYNKVAIAERAKLELLNLVVLANVQWLPIIAPTSLTTL